MNSLLEPEGSDKQAADQTKSAVPVVPIFDAPVASILDAGEGSEGEPYALSEGKALSNAESVRAGGLAWSAAIALFGAVIIMLIIGWGADLLFGSSPWGIVVGIILGAAIGFIQFFRITREIFKK